MRAGGGEEHSECVRKTWAVQEHPFDRKMGEALEPVRVPEACGGCWDTRPIQGRGSGHLSRFVAQGFRSKSWAGGGPL